MIKIFNRRNLSKDDFEDGINRWLDTASLYRIQFVTSSFSFINTGLEGNPQKSKPVKHGIALATSAGRVFVRIFEATEESLALQG